MDSRNRTRVPGVQRIEQVECFTAAYFANDQPVRPVPQRRFDQIPNGDRRDCLRTRAVNLFLSRFEAKDVWMVDLQFGCILNDAQALVLRDEVDQSLREGRFAGVGPAGDQDCLAIADGLA